MSKPQESALVEVRKDGVAGNGRLTAALGALLLVLLAVEGATIPFIGQLRKEHILIGMLLLGPVAAKLVPGPAFADWRRRGPRLIGAGLRLAAITAALAIGVGLTLLSFSAAGSWG